MALQLTGWQVVEQEAGITVTRLSSSAAEVLERCCVRVCVWHNVSACHGGKWWQTMANWSEGFLLLTHHANNGESEAWSGWENGCHKHIHGHTKVAGTQSKIAQKASESHSHREVGDHGTEVQRRLGRRALFHTDMPKMSTFFIHFAGPRNRYIWNV